LCGELLALAGAWALARFVFNIPFAPNALPVILPLLILPVLTSAIGLMMSRGILNRPPLELLRVESA
ncbi:MAG TPA: hypothetical protein VH280_05270, partial [Verrucomicrobiae bacterium]|nr:hypothetical protein [Verrucomicrobiae bacterium]